VKLSIEIDTGSAAFDPDPDAEVARILNGFAALVDVLGLRGGWAIEYHSHPPYDVNGNRCGEWAVRP